MNKMAKLKPIVLSGPSGSGKSTLLKKLFTEFPDAFGFSVSHTTRPPRVGEQDGIDYHFVTREKMQEEIARNNFIEYAEFANKMYGTCKQSIYDVLQSNRICILDVDEQGVKNIKNTDLEPKFIFIEPPSLEELEKRLKSRGTETNESLRRRMETASSAMNYSKKKDVYDIKVVNNDLDTAYTTLRSYLIEEFPECLVSNINTNYPGPAGDSSNITKMNKSVSINVENNNKSSNITTVAKYRGGISNWFCTIL